MTLGETDNFFLFGLRCSINGMLLALTFQTFGGICLNLPTSIMERPTAASPSGDAVFLCLTPSCRALQAVVDGFAEAFLRNRHDRNRGGGVGIQFAQHSEKVKGGFW
jgi:hypothetical protein